jgi:hypothetical protein
MRARLAVSALLFVLVGTVGRSALADVVIPYNEYSASPTIGRGNGTSTDPNQPGYGAMRIFIEKVMDYTGALPGGQKVTFRPDPGTGRAINALRAGVQFANQNGQPRPIISEPSWGFAYNSVPFAMSFAQMLEFLHDAKLDDAGRNGIQLAQALLDRRGGTQVVFPIVGSTMQGSGYFPLPLGKPICHAGDTDCQQKGDGIGLAGLCASGWRIRYLAPPEDVLSLACDMLVKQGTIKAKTLTFYPAVGGQSVLLPMQKSAIQGFEFITPVDDLVDFFPVKDSTPSRPLGNPDAGSLDCGPAADFPMPAGTKSTCSQNIGQIGSRYAHYPAWHQPFLISWMHVEKTMWNGLSAEQRAAILRAARESVSESYHAAESIACRKLKDMLDFNDGVNQRNLDGTVRLVDGKPVSARITMAPWPEEALKVLRAATTAYLASLAGPSDASARSDVQREFASVLDAMTRFGGSAGATKLPAFPATTGLAPGETCRLAP